MKKNSFVRENNSAGRKLRLGLTLLSVAMLLSCASTLAEELTLDNATVVLHRTAQFNYATLSEGRDFARGLTATINESQRGLVKVYFYEEHFGTHFRAHWLILFKDLDGYNELRKNLTSDQNFLRMAPESVWAEYFVQSSIQDELIQTSIPMMKR